MPKKKSIQRLFLGTLLACGCQGQDITWLGAGNLSILLDWGTLHGPRKVSDSSLGLQLWTQNADYAFFML